MYPIYAFGSEAQKRHWLPRLARGEAIGCFGLTEPDFGSNPGGMLTRAVPSRRRLSAQRHQALDHQRLDRRRRAGVGEGADGDDATSIRGFLVETRHAGLQRPRDARQVQPARLDHLRADPRGLRRPRGERPARRAAACKAPLSCLTQARYGIAWGAIGAAIACYECALDYAKRARHVQPADRAATSSCRRSSSTMVTEITKAQLLCLRLGRLKDAGKHAPRAGVAGEDEQRLAGAAHRAPGARHPRRQRHHRRVPGHPPHAEPRDGEHLRGHGGRAPAHASGATSPGSMPSSSGERSYPPGDAPKRACRDRRCATYGA